ncbi:TPR-like protein [Cadophora sp. DSE1049]|nr:TPR-like protein [Cadophora sp. DSE1049]
MDDLRSSVEVADLEVEAIPQDHPNRAGWLKSLGNRLGRRFGRTGLMNNLNRAIEVADMAVEATPQDHPDRAGRLNNLGNNLGLRFGRTGSMNDLNRAIEVTDIAVKATPKDHPNRAGWLNSLGVWLSRRFERTGFIDDLNRAVEVADMAVKATPQDHPDRAIRLNNLGSWLGKRFERTGLIDDLNRAVEVADMAVKATPQDHPNRAIFLNSQGAWLGRRFDRTGLTDDLNRAVEVADIAVEVTPQDHPNRAAFLQNLGVWLGRRFQRTGSIDDISRAVEVADMAVKATPRDHPDRAAHLNNLGTWLSKRFERTGSIDDINRAVEVADIAVKATPQDYPDRAGRLNNLGNNLGLRFDRTGSIDDVNRAVEVADMAVEATPQNHPNRAAILNNLGHRLGRRFERTRSIDDLNRAVEVAEMAVEATLQDHPSGALHLSNLGDWLGTRFDQTKAIGDLERSISSFTKGWNCPSAPPSIRIRLARKVARYLASQSDWEGSSTLLEDAVKRLPTHMLADFAGLASMAAATALNAGKEAHHALKLLELGRGVIAGLLLEIRTDISDLERQHPELAEEFVSLRDELDSPAATTAPLTILENASSVESRGKRRREAEKRFPVVLAEIRSKRGFLNFLLPPTPDELETAADPGPIVVINQTLQWLWDVAASPILEELGFKEPPSKDNWPHIWWILTGQLSQLPFHAAGRHFIGSIDTVLDRAMSSYSSSIKALIYGRRHRGANPIQQASENALLITVPESGLPFALDEVAMLEKLCPLLKLNPVKPVPQRDEVLAHLRACKIFHFASHGQSNPLEPSESCLVLSGENNSVTVADLRDCRLQENSPFLAYLSACSTKVNVAERLVDEEIHLVSACQLAGFRHVIGTLWKVSDQYCVNVARILYETIKDEGMTDHAVCRGLHRAIRALRDKDMVRQTREEGHTAGNVTVNKDETSGGEADMNVDNNVTGVIEGKVGQWTHPGKDEIVYGETITPWNRNGTVNAGREQQKSVDKLDGGGDKPRQSHWGVTGGSLRLAGPLIWAAYIHAGL